MQLARSPAVLWRALEHSLVHETHWYRKNKREAPETILSVIRAAPCACGCGIEIAAHSVAPADGQRLARGMAEALVEYAMECELNGHAHSSDRWHHPVDSPRGVRVIIREQSMS